ncbi:hypothetical protein Hamer_G003152 [Homarus americanus]|uniref:Uncharacterized protein n=1 Tax=Homarus americanus TaxID=6706 RepID=A0A8J5TKZ8_HOMAM|nr:hypothetical protein Hamer_G003152 [Homarus americanus]
MLPVQAAGVSFVMSLLTVIVAKGQTFTHSSHSPQTLPRPGVLQNHDAEESVSILYQQVTNKPNEPKVTYNIIEPPPLKCPGPSEFRDSSDNKCKVDYVCRFKNMMNNIHKRDIGRGSGTIEAADIIDTPPLPCPGLCEVRDENDECTIDFVCATRDV